MGYGCDGIKQNGQRVRLRHNMLVTLLHVTRVRRHLGLALIQDYLGAYHKHGPEGCGRSGFTSARNKNNSLQFSFLNSLLWIICQI